jgi:uncharacterized membrane protein
MGITRRHEHGQILIVFAVTATALLAVIGLVYTFGLVLGQRRALQTAADAASLSGSWAILQNAPTDAQVALAVLLFAKANGWSADGAVEDDAHLCPAVGQPHLCAYYVYASGDLVCASTATVHVGAGGIPAQARGVQVTVTRQMPTILPGFVPGEALQTRVQATGAAAARPTTTIPALVPEPTNVC